MSGIEASEIAPGLWMGSRPSPGPALRRAGVGVVVLCAYEYQPSPEWFPGVQVARICLDDNVLPRKDGLEAFLLAARLARLIRDGQKVLITCSQGRNRSGLLAALTLARMTGCSGARAAAIVRSRRHSPFGPALTNNHYVNALLEVPARPNVGPVTAHAARLAGV